jgi:uncharacterized protein YyaL (SSP411 family)
MAVDVSSAGRRLATATSPYLRQHASDPVDWYPWGEEAFARARALDRPIFLSIGYSACHWCHVMQHESFADADTARALNEGFVAIKVDREERPDVDALYVQALLEFQGDAGWPATLFLFPDLRPFTGATYLPREPRFGLPSLRQVLARVRELWASDRASLEGAADLVKRRLFEPPARADTATEAGYRAAVAGLVAIADRSYGGFGSGQKFPQTPELELLLLGAHDGIAGAAEALRRTLMAMDRGGLQDHLGGGFHRYCVDRTWTIPHFEKMLYDNAQLVRLYARASSFLASQGREALEEVRAAVRVVRDAVGYVDRDLVHPDGGWCASEDADDPGGEGFFYTWTPAEARAALGPADALPYGIRPAGNFDDGRTVLTTRSGVPDASVRDALKSARDARPRPSLDEKRVVAWNGLAIGAFAEAGRLFAEDRWVDRAAAAADRLLGAAGRTLEGDAPMVLDDPVFLADGLLALYQARPWEHRWLLAAADLADLALARFGDPGGACWTSERRPDLFVRRKELTDGAEPSGNGRLCEVLRSLEAYGAPVSRALDDVLAEATGAMRENGLSTPEMWRVVRAREADPRTGPVALVIAGDPSDRRTKLLLRVWSRSWRPHGVVAIADTAAPRERFALLRDKHPASDGTPLAFVCRNGRCDFPVASIEDLGNLLS